MGGIFEAVAVERGTFLGLEFAHPVADGWGALKVLILEDRAQTTNA